MKKSKVSINENAVLRARRSIACLPFKKIFYEEIDKKSISADDLCKRDDLQRIVFAPFGAKRAEAHFQWMIKLGILRREVDGQGLTSRVRLTPMGRKLIASEKGEIKRAGFLARFLETLKRKRSKFQS